MINKIKRYLAARNEKRKANAEKFSAATWNLGFDKIEFPIIIKEDEDLFVIANKEHFFGDVDLYFFEFEPGTLLIDAQGREFTWAYSIRQNSNYPDKFIRQLTVEELREIADRYFKHASEKPTLGGEKSIRELIDRIGGVDGKATN